MEKVEGTAVELGTELCFRFADKVLPQLRTQMPQPALLDFYVGAFCALVAELQSDFGSETAAVVLHRVRSELTSGELKATSH